MKKFLVVPIGSIFIRPAHILRGGRLAKISLFIVSLAPLLVAGAEMLFPYEASAQCTDSAGLRTCSGPLAIPSPGNPLGSTTRANQASGVQELILDGTTGTITVSSAGVGPVELVRGPGWNLDTRVETLGVVSITATGASNSRGVRVFHGTGAEGNISIETSELTDVRTTGTGGSNHAIFGSYDNLNTGSGSVTIVNNGALSTSGASSHGIFGRNLGTGSSFATHTGNIITTGDLSHGIQLRNQGVGAANSIVRAETSGDITTGGAGAMGVYVFVDNNASASHAIIEMNGGRIETTDVGSHGLYALNRGVGDTDISMIAGTISTLAENAHGIFAEQTNTPESGNIGIVVAGTGEITSTSGDGVRVQANPNLPSDRNSIEYTVHVLDDAVVSGGTAGIRTLSGLGDQGDILVGEGARVLGGIYDTDGDATVIIAGTIDGEVSLGDGTDLLTIASTADISGVTLLDGGDDYGAEDTFIDVLTFDGWEGAVDGATVVKWEQIFATNGASVSFGSELKVGVDEDDVAEDGMGLFVQAGGTLVAENEFALTGNLNILGGGTVDLTNGASVGDVVTVNGDVIGDGGMLSFNVDFENGHGDTLVVNGDTSGPILIAANNQGTPGLANGETITLVEVRDGNVNGADYELAGGAIEIGAWTYNLDAGQTTDLVALLAAINEIGAVYESAPSVLLNGFASLPTLEQRVGQRQWLIRGDDGLDGVWMRIHGERARVTPRQSDSAASLRSSSWGLELGADFLADESENGYWVLGVTGQYGRTSADVSNALGDGGISVSGYGLGATATWHGYGGTYLDLQGQANRISADYSTAVHGSLASNRSATAYALSAELGHRYTLDDDRQHALVPQAQLSWGKVTGGSFTDSQGNDVALGTNARTMGRIGLAYEYRPNGLTEGQRANDEQMIYGIANILHDFSSSSSVNVAGTTLQSQGARTWGEIGFGGSVEVAPNVMLSGQASYRLALSSGASVNNSLHGTVGLRFQW